MTAVERLLKSAEGKVGVHEEHVFSPEQTVPWPKVFVDGCFTETFGVETTRKLLCDYQDPVIGNSANQYRDKDLYFDVPRIGDLAIIRHSSGAASHTGIVFDMDADSIYTVEGDVVLESGTQRAQVVKRKHLRSGGQVEGYARPDWKMLPAAGVSDYDRLMIISMKETYFETPQYKSTGVWTEEVIGS